MAEHGWASLMDLEMAIFTPGLINKIALETSKKYILEMAWRASLLFEYLMCATVGWKIAAVGTCLPRASSHDMFCWETYLMHLCFSLPNL